MKDENNLWFLLALNHLRNKLAHADWYGVTGEHAQSCDKKRQKNVMNILGLTDDDFEEKYVKPRISHHGSASI